MNKKKKDEENKTVGITDISVWKHESDGNL